MKIAEWKFIKKNGKFGWEAFNVDGEKVGESSQLFTSKKSAQYNSRLLGYEDNFSKQLVWEFYEEGGKWKWKNHNKINKENVAKSFLTFTSRAQAEKNAALFGYELVTVAPMVAEPVGENGKKTGDGLWWLSWIKWILFLLILALLGWLFLAPLLRRGWDWIQREADTISQNEDDSDTSENKESKVLAALDDPKYSTFARIIEAGMSEGDLDSNVPITLFAPTNLAFNSLPEGVTNSYLNSENKVAIKNFVSRLAYKGDVDYASIEDQATVQNILGTDETVTVVGPVKTISNGLTVLPSSVKTDSGIRLYSVDEFPFDVPLLLPPVVSMPMPMEEIEEPEVEVEMMEPIEEESNDVEEQSDTDGIEVTEQEEQMEPEVEEPATVSEPEKTTQPDTSNEPQQNVQAKTYKSGGFLDTAQKAGNFTYLLRAVEAAGLVDDIENLESATLFAPTDEAFKRLGSKYDDLLKPENKDQLVDILLYHVSDTEYSYATFFAGVEVTTLNGNTVTLTTDGYTPCVVAAGSISLAPVDDITTSNGVIHVLTDNVLLQ